MAQFVRDYLDSHAGGAARADVVAALAENPAFARSMARNRTLISCLIGRLVERGEISRVDDRLILAQHACGRETDRSAGAKVETSV